ncbi:MAG: efflux RND transporter periplasmic adaptor subunit [Burkholderiales bacterium]|nr:efflux RND transporter periplasmic adaptor subunit [Burkholderiales bacterium]
MKKTLSLGTVALAALGLCAQVQAHGDEDHSNDKKPVTANVQAATGALVNAELVAAQRLADGSLLVPKSVQHQLGLRTVQVALLETAATVEFSGKVVADANASGVVQASQAGRIEPGPKGLPTLGQKVTKGQTLAYLRPQVSSLERSANLAQLAELDAQLNIAQRKVQRYEQLQGSVPQAGIDAARIEWESLKQRRQALAGGLLVSEGLLAPVTGVVSSVRAVIGQVVDAKDVLFEIVDPSRLAVEALAYDATVLNGLASANAVIPGGSLTLQYVGAGQQLREQAIPLLFRITGSQTPVAVGQPVKVIAQTAQRVKGASIAIAAVVKGSTNQASVWVHTAPERFVLRKVSAHALSAGQMVVTSGLASGERVVVEGAGLLAQVK